MYDEGDLGVVVDVLGVVLCVDGVEAVLALLNCFKSFFFCADSGMEETCA